VLYRGPERLRIDGVWCLPVEEFLRRMVPEQGLLDGLTAGVGQTVTSR